MSNILYTPPKRFTYLGKLETRGKRYFHPPIAKEIMEKAKDMWVEGYTTSQIGAALGINRNSVWNLVHRRKLESTPLRYKPRHYLIHRRRQK